MALTEIVRRDDSPQYPNQLKQRFVSFDGGAGNYTLVEAVEGKQLQIISFKMSANVNGTYTLRSGTDNIFPFPLMNTGGIFHASSDLDMPLFCSNIGGDLNITTTAAVTSGGVNLFWREK